MTEPSTTVIIELLEGYVLAAIGHLPDDEHQRIGDIARRLFGGGDDWRASVRRALQIGVELDAGVQKLWIESQEAATDGDDVISAADFSRAVVIENFGPLLEA